MRPRTGSGCKNPIRSPLGDWVLPARAGNQAIFTYVIKEIFQTALSDRKREILSLERNSNCWKMYHAKPSMRTAEARGKLTYIRIAVVFSSPVQRNLCIEKIILIETQTFTNVCLTHTSYTEGLCVSVSLVSEVIFGSTGVVK